MLQMWSDISRKKLTQKTYYSKTWGCNMPQFPQKFMYSQKVLLQPQSNGCKKCGKYYGKKRIANHNRAGFSQPAHHTASGEGTGGGHKGQGDSSRDFSPNLALPVAYRPDHGSQSENPNQGSTIKDDARYDKQNGEITEIRDKININKETPTKLYDKNKNIVFNYSNIVMTDPMLRLLNRGLNFSLLPYKLDITQTLVEFRKFERAAIWHEFHYGKENNEDFEKHIFK